MGTNIPLVRNQITGSQGMAQGNGENRENSTIHVVSGIPDPLRSQTKWQRITAVRGLPGT